MMLFIVGLASLEVIAVVLLLFLLFRGHNVKTLEGKIGFLGDNVVKIESAIRDEMSKSRQESSTSLKNFGDSTSNQIIGLTQLNEQKLDNIRKTVEERLKAIQDDSSQKLEKMRETVDEKLHNTLEQRLGDSFKLVCDRLDQVHRGLGEMQTLAIGVGDLKKVLSNVKIRGTLGEIQLGNILEQILTPEQYAKNVATKTGSRENVEYAIKLPGRNDDPVWLPIDSKFPMEDYQRLIDAQEQANIGLIEELSKSLEARIKQEAKDIKDKYIDPPNTTDFGILFLPFEGLYAEVLKRPGLYELLQRQYNVVITGPSTIAAFLNSLNMGFRTLVIEKRASEVWGLLGAVKTEFSKFGDILEKTHKQLEAASNTIIDAAKKTRTIERKLKEVQAIPAQETVKLLEGSEENSRPDVA